MRKADFITDLNRLIGQNLRSIRTDLQMSQPEVAAMLRITYQQYRKYESGENHIAASQLAVLLVAGWPADRIFQSIQTIAFAPKEKRDAVKLMLASIAESKRPQYGELPNE